MKQPFTIVIDRHDHGASVLLDQAAKKRGVVITDGDDLSDDPVTRFGPDDRVVITSENVLDAVLRRLDDQSRVDLIDALKNKHRCRQMIKDLYPDFYFERCALPDLPSIKLPPGRQFVVKPNRGYFATAIKIVDSESNLENVAQEIEADVGRNASVFATTVLSDAEVIIEEFITGDEYAVDMFFDGQGQPVIMNVYHHPIPDNPNYLHALYYTSKHVFDLLHDRLVDWFSHLNETLQATAFPIHAEFRLTASGIVPIELNPLRYGGDGLIDLTYHAFGFDPYEAYFNDIRPDWPAIWAGRDDKIYTWMMGYVGTEVDVETHRPDIGAFQSLFSNILSDALLNYEAHLGFSVVYSEETSLDTVMRLVNTDFKDFFLGAGAFTEEALTRLYAGGVRLGLDPGTTIWEEGDIGDYALLVIEGSIDVLHRQKTRADVVLGSVGPKMVVGEFAVMDGRPRSAAAQAGAKGATAMRISGEAFRKLLREAPSLFEELYWQQQMRIRNLNRRIADLESEVASLKSS